jgi:hypothetical protein
MLRVEGRPVTHEQQAKELGAMKRLTDLRRAVAT